MASNRNITPEPINQTNVHYRLLGIARENSECVLIDRDAHFMRHTKIIIILCVVSVFIWRARVFVQ